MIGRVLGGRYELGEVLGYGGMAEVFLGTDVRLGRRVAVKVLRADLARDPTFLARFRREAQSAASLQNPAIVAVFDTGSDVFEEVGGPGLEIPWIVMEYIEGRTLREVLREEGRLPPRRAVELVAEVSGALAYAHHAGFIHRDIKPGNVMLTPNGQVKVMDFGIARAVTSASGALTQTAAIVGTAQYLSPEQARGEHVDARSDIYSAGCLLYELLTGRPPFTGDSPVSVAYQHVREEAVAPSKLEPEISDDLDAVVLKAMAKSPTNRYQSGEAFRDDLLRIASGRRVHVTPPPASDLAGERTMVMSAAGATTVLSSSAAQEAERARRRRGYTAIFGACFVVLILVALLVRSALSTGSGGTVQMPTLLGLTKAQALQVLGDKGLKPGKIDTVYEKTDANKGNVVEQAIQEHFQVNSGSEVGFTVSAGIEFVPVPTVVSFTQADAEKALKDAGFVVVTARQQPDLTKDPGTVLSINPAEGTSVPKGTRVQLTVVAGKASVPNLTGLTRDKAAEALTKAGFTLGAVTGQPSTQPVDTVISQSVAPTTQADRGTAIAIVLAQVPPSPTPSPTPSDTSSPSPTDTSTPTSTPTP